MQKVVRLCCSMGVTINDRLFHRSAFCSDIYMYVEKFSWLSVSNHLNKLTFWASHLNTLRAFQHMPFLKELASLPLFRYKMFWMTVLNYLHYILKAELTRNCFCVRPLCDPAAPVAVSGIILNIIWHSQLRSYMTANYLTMYGRFLWTDTCSVSLGKSCVPIYACLTTIIFEISSQMGVWCIPFGERTFPWDKWRPHGSSTVRSQLRDLASALWLGKLCQGSRDQLSSVCLGKYEKIWMAQTRQPKEQTLTVWRLKFSNNFASQRTLLWGIWDDWHMNWSAPLQNLTYFCICLGQ